MAFESLLVVCVGNICRSPMAAALLMDKYPYKIIDSAGLSAVVGHPADDKAQAVMAADDLDLSQHIAKQIDENMVMNADLILTMSVHQNKWIESRWPHCRGKTFRIGHWLKKDIADPYQHDKSVFEATRKDIIASLERWHDKID